MNACRRATAEVAEDLGHAGPHGPSCPLEAIDQRVDLRVAPRLAQPVAHRRAYVIALRVVAALVGVDRSHEQINQDFDAMSHGRHERQPNE